MVTMRCAAVAALILGPSLGEAQDVKPRAVLSGHKGWVSYLSFSPDGKIMVSGSHKDGTIRLWDPATGAQRGVIDTHSEVFHPSLSPDGKTIAASSSYHMRRVGRRRIFPDGNVTLWDVATGQGRVIWQGPEIVFAVKYSPDGRFVAFSTSGSQALTTLWDVHTEKVVTSIAGHSLPTLPFCNDIAFSRDGTTMALASGSDVELWDTKTWQKHVTLTGHTGMSYSLSLSPDGMWVASGGADDTVRVWYMNTNNLRVTLRGFHGNVFAVAFSPDGKLLAAANKYGKLWLFGTGNFETLAVIKADKGTINAVPFFPDGKTVATASSTIKLWDVETLLREAKPKGDADRIEAR